MRLDLTGEVCPFTFVRTKLALEEMALGEVLEVFVDHPPAAENVPRSLRSEGQEVASVSAFGAGWLIRAIKRTEHRLQRGRATDLDAAPPHGGTLVSRRPDGKHAAELRERAPRLPRIELHGRELADLELIASGALSPLEGFMGRGDYESVVEAGRLGSGLPWTLPITLSVPRDAGLSAEVALQDPDGTLLAVLEVEDLWAPDKELEALRVYGTNDHEHPGVAQLHELDEWYAGGKIWLLEGPSNPLDPRGARAAFRERGWQRIAGFPIHRGQEHLVGVALERVDGLLIHTPLGQNDDLPLDARVLRSSSPLATRWAGPKEAIHQAIVSKNHGCTHFVVAGGTDSAARAFDQYGPSELGITPLGFEDARPHGDANRVMLSETRVTK